MIDGKSKFIDAYGYYLTFDKNPIPYVPTKYKKKQEKILHLHAVRVKDFYDYSYYVKSLLYEKDKEDVKFISMKYLDYIRYHCNLESKNEKKYKAEMSEDKLNIASRFFGILSLVTKIPIWQFAFFKDARGNNVVLAGAKVCYKKCSKDTPGAIFVVNKTLNKSAEITAEMLNELSKEDWWFGDKDFKLGDYVVEILNSDEVIELSRNDIDNIKQIILYQNDKDYDDTNYSADIKQAMKELQEFKRKTSNGTTTDLKHQILGLQMIMHRSEEEVINMTIREFTMALKMSESKFHYELMANAQCNGFVKVKQMPPHWQCEVDDRFDGMMSVDDLNKKIGN